MASSLQFFLLFPFIFIITFSVAQRPNLPNGVVLPVTKDVSTLQYVTHIYLGTALVPINLVVDLGGPFLWLDCASTSTYVSSSLLQCSMAKANVCDNNTCCLNPENTFTRMATSGELAEDIMAFHSSEMGSISIIHRFLFSCAPALLLQGLTSGVKGMLGLGRTRISLPSQLSNTFGFHRKFAVCLSSSNGVILTGDEPYMSLSGTDISKSLVYTSLISNQGSDILGGKMLASVTFDNNWVLLREYFINVKSIKINGKRLSIIGGIGGTKISTVVPYTTMESTIYDTFTNAYVKVAASMNMTRVPSMTPFEVCFSSKGIDNMRVGLAVPTIDLVLQSEMVKWRIHGRNSMVKVSDEVMCLGFLDGGLSPRTSIVIGGYQLEDNLVEFNMGTSMLGFSSSLLMRQTSCSDIKLYSMRSESL